jgi:hypothetical protein
MKIKLTNNFIVRMAIFLSNNRLEIPLSRAFFNENTNDVPNIQTKNGKTISAMVIPCHGA